MSVLDKLFGHAAAEYLGPVRVADSDPPVAGNNLVAVDLEQPVSRSARWAVGAPLEPQTPPTRVLATTAPLSGGGNLTADRTLALAVGTTAGTVAPGNATLLRAAGDFASAPAKATVDATDRVLVEQPTKARVTLASIASGITKWKPTRNPYAIAPAPTPTPTFDDEFDSGSDDLAVRGWTIRTSAGLLTRAGGIIQYGAGPGGSYGGLSNSQYRSSLVGSTLFVEIAPGAGLTWIVKPVTLAAQGTLVVSAGQWITDGNVGGVGATYVAGTAVSVWENHGGAYRLYTNPPGNQWPVSAGNNAFDISVVQYAIRHSGTNTYQCFVANESGCLFADVPGAGAYPVASVTGIGFRIVPAPSFVTTVALHFARYFPGDSWIAGTP